MSRQVWEPQLPLASDLKLVSWDLPQHGELVQSDAVISLSDCATALYELVQDLKIEQGTYVGWSMGMSVFWRYCELFGSDPFVRVINVEMLPVMDPKQAQVEAVEGSLRLDRHRAMERFASKVFYQADPVEIKEIVRAADEVPLETAINLYREMATTNFSKIAQKLTIPQTLVFGSHGFYAEHRQLIDHFFPKDQQVWFEHSAHAPFWEEGERFNDFLRQLTGVADSR